MKKLKLSKKFQYRNRLVRNLVSSLVLFEQITTTGTKASSVKAEMQRMIEKLHKTTDEVSLKRYLASTLYGGAKEKAFDNRDKLKGVKVYRLGKRVGDGADMVLVKLLIESTKSKEVKPKTKSVSGSEKK